MRIPKIRDRLHKLADELGVEELHNLAEETRRRPPIRRARARWPKLSDREAQAVRQTFGERPDLGVRELADMYRTSIGRVSEAIRGFRA